MLYQTPFKIGFLNRLFELLKHVYGKNLHDLKFYQFFFRHSRNILKKQPKSIFLKYKLSFSAISIVPTIENGDAFCIRVCFSIHRIQNKPIF